MKRLRAAVLLPDANIPTWAAALLENIENSHTAEVVSVFQIRHEPREPGWLYKIHFKIDQRIFPYNPNPWGKTEVKSILPKTHVYTGTLEQHIVHLKTLKIDILINLCLHEVPQALLEHVRHGVWTLCDGQGRFVIGDQVGWREIMEHDPLTVCALEVARHKHPAVIAAKNIFGTDPLSLTLNQKSILWKAALIVPRALKHLHDRGEKDFLAHAEEAAVSHPTNSMPNALQTVRFFLRQMRDTFERKIWRRMFPNRWRLMIGFQSGESFQWNKFKSIVPPRGAFWADPFVMERNQTTYIFFEELLYRTHLGRINCLQLDQNNQVSDVQTVLERPYHLSYPFMFEWRGEFFMIPETAQHRAIEVYRCTRWPDRWEFHKTIMPNIHAVDTTLLHHGGRWWMFTNIKEHGGSTFDELFLFYADDPLSAHWTPHPRSPIVTDVRSARPAGRIFRRDSKLIRPSQDSSKRYGYAINLNHIETLTTHEYKESPIERIEPRDEDMLAVHTYNFTDKVVVLDALFHK